jgi:hypothetical protein
MRKKVAKLYSVTAAIAEKRGREMSVLKSGACRC